MKTEEEQLKYFYEVSKKLHEGQFRRDGVTPYFDHVEKVYNLCDTFKEKVIALFHDVIEDDRSTEKELQKLEIPEWAIEGIVALTKKSKESYTGFIQRMLESDYRHRYRRVKIADIVANLSDSPTEKQIEKYHAALIQIAEYEEYEYQIKPTPLELWANIYLGTDNKEKIRGIHDSKEECINSPRYGALRTAKFVEVPDE